MRFSTKALMVVGFPVLGLALMLSVSLFEIGSDLQLTKKLVAMNEAQRQHGLADMMHDHVYGTGYQALYGLAAGQPAVLRAARDEMAQATQQLEAALHSSREQLARVGIVLAGEEVVARDIAAYGEAGEALVASEGEAAALLPEFTRRFESLETSLEARGEQLAALARDMSEVEVSSAESLLQLLIGAAVLLVLVSGWVIWRGLRELANLHGADPEELRSLLQAIGEHRLGGIAISGKKGSLRAGVGQLASNLAGVVEGLRRQITEELTPMTSQVGSASEECRTAAERQQSQVEQLTTASTEMAATSQDVSRATQEAADAARHATLATDEGRQAASRSIEAIDEIGRAHV